MNNFSSKVRESINKYSPNEIIVARDLYYSKFKGSNENLFYKALERMCKSNELRHLGKGIYYRPMMSKYGELPLDINKVIDFYTKDNKGVEVGYSLFNKKNITTQSSNKYLVFSSNLFEDKKRIDNVIIIKIPFLINKKRRNAIEVLEILENYNDIEDANYNQLIKLLNDYIENYDEKSLKYVLNNKKYKKSTIASLKTFLDKSHIKNSLDNYLSPFSKYKVIGEQK